MTNENKNKSKRILSRGSNDIDGGPISGSLNTDSSFSDKGLNNSAKTRKAVNLEE